MRPRWPTSPGRRVSRPELSTTTSATRTICCSPRWTGPATRSQRAIGADADPLHRLVSSSSCRSPTRVSSASELLLWLEVWLRARHRPNLILESYKLSVSWQQRMTAAIEQARSPAP